MKPHLPLKHVPERLVSVNHRGKMVETTACGRSPQLVDADGTVIAEVNRQTSSGGRCEVAEANAAFLCRAANAHDALVTACEKALEFLGGFGANPSIGKELRAALAAAQPKESEA